MNNDSHVVPLQFTIIFVDTEGTPIQELSALEMRLHDRQIVDVFHGHADMKEEQDKDKWARKHVHGLSVSFLKENGYSSELELIIEFKCWLRGKNYLNVFSNAPKKEEDALSLNICDIALPPWIERHNQPYHIIAKCFKDMNLALLNKSCSREAHSAYEGVDRNQHGNPLIQTAKERHGYHCSLYDCWEMYLCFILS